MVKWKIVYSKQAQKDSIKARSSNLKPKIEELLDLISCNPLATYPPYEKLEGDMEGAYSRRINKQHRLVYKVLEKEGVIHVLRMWTHYE